MARRESRERAWDAPKLKITENIFIFLLSVA
jgi:hypothetical protein